MSRGSRMSTGMLLILLPSVNHAGRARGVSCGRVLSFAVGLTRGVQNNR